MPAQKKTKDTRKRTNVFIDFHNLSYYLQKHNWTIDWKKFRSYLKKSYNLVDIYYYEGKTPKAVYFDCHPTKEGYKLKDFIDFRKALEEYFKFLKRNKYIVRNKWVSRIHYQDEEGEHRIKHKCNFDVEITLDVLDTIEDYDICILCTGDGDFVKLVKYLKGKHKEVIVIAGKDRLAVSLRKASNSYYYLKDLKNEIEQKE